MTHVDRKTSFPTGGTASATVAAGPFPGLEEAALDRLMPMHVMLEADGCIGRAARTVRKLCPQAALEGANLFELFEVRRPRGAASVRDLLQAEGGRVSLAFRDGGHGSFKAVVVPNGAAGGALLNLSFGLSLVDAVRAYDLTVDDFAGTDLAIEMLYLVESKSLAAHEFKKLSQRLEGAKIAAEEQAFTDTLTGLKNRRALDHVLSRFSRAAIPFGLLHLDLDYFKQVNDTYGHAAGDEVLQVVAGILVHETRQSDTVARVGGDEFIIVFQRLVDIDILQEISARIIRSLELPIPYNGETLAISGSIGLITSEMAGSISIEEMLEMVDLALYASKRAGRGRATVAAPSADIGGADDRSAS